MADTAAKTEVPKGAEQTADLATTDAIRARILTAYKEMLTCQFIGCVGIMVILAAVLGIGYKTSWSPPLLPLVALSGALGAFFSALTRLYHVDDAGTALITTTVGGLNGWYMAMYATVPPVIGAVAAIVLYMLFVSGLVAGELFPVIDCKIKDACTDIGKLMDMYWPVTPHDYGKALVWSFIAGFSERFVPDLLQSLVKKEESKRKAKASGK